MATYFWVGGSGTWNNVSTTNWAVLSGGVGGFGPPLAADTANFDANSGTSAVVTIINTAVSLSTTINKADINLSLSGNATLCTSVGVLTLTTGTITLNNNTLSVGFFSSVNSNTRSVDFGTGNITLTGSGNIVWNMSTATGFTYIGTPTVNCTYSGAVGTRSIRMGNSTGATETNAPSFNITAGADTFSINSGSSVRNLIFTGFAGSFSNNSLLTFGNITFSSGMTLGTGGSQLNFKATLGTQQITTNAKTLDFPLTFNGVGGTFAFQDALTQGSTRAFTITNGTVQLKAGVTSTVGSFVANNANTKSLQSTTSGSQATISQASGTVVVADLTIQDSNAIGGASWNAYADYENIDAGNNDGWDFSLSPPYATYEPPIIIRSFTQPRRF